MLKEEIISKQIALRRTLMTGQFSLGYIAFTTLATSTILIAPLDSVEVEGNDRNNKETITIASSLNSSRENNLQIASNVIETKNETSSSNLVSAIASGSITVFGLCGLARLGSYYKPKEKRKKKS